ncbi:hypothetical protein [Mycobacterium sp.]|nr:hypothetical protein [Mycobacterium sp.]HTQ17691.1 hypothetical protein [Mycobacterium sp.]
MDQPADAPAASSGEVLGPQVGVHQNLGALVAGGAVSATKVWA